MMADLIAEALHVGFRDLTMAAIPETCGHAMEVPESTLTMGVLFLVGLLMCHLQSMLQVCLLLVPKYQAAKQ